MRLDRVHAKLGFERYVRSLGILVLLVLAACRGDRNDAMPRPSPTTDAASPIRQDAPSAPGWPAGDSLQASLPADPGAVSMRKSLYRNGDVVLEQRWPDGTRERWWYPQEGEPRYIGRDGKEFVGRGAP